MSLKRLVYLHFLLVTFTGAQWCRYGAQASQLVKWAPPPQLLSIIFTTGKEGPKVCTISYMHG